MPELQHKHCRPYFYEGVEEIKENDKNTKIENFQNGRQKYGGKNLVYVYSSGKNKKRL